MEGRGRDEGTSECSLEYAPALLRAHVNRK